MSSVYSRLLGAPLRGSLRSASSTSSRLVVQISLRPCASALNQTSKLKVACFFTAASPRRLRSTVGSWQMRKGFPQRPGLVAYRRRALRKPSSFPHLPFASYSNLPLALRRGREDRRLDSARCEATSPGPRLMPTDRTAKLKSPTVVCARFACAEGVRLAEAEGRAAKRSQEPERK